MGYSRKDIYDTSPLAIKNMNDNFKYLWFKTFGNLTDADMSENANINGSKIKTGSISANKIEANSITADQIAAESITSDKIVAGAITADKIDVTSLYVGTGGITLDSRASIDWNEVNPPSYSDVGAMPAGTYIPPGYSDSQALQAWVASGYKTHIDANGIYTGSINAIQITAGSITGDKITGGTIVGTQLQTAASGQMVQVFSSYARGIDSNNRNRWEIGGVPGGASYLSMYSEDGLYQTSMFFYGTSMGIGSSSVDVNITGATVKANGSNILTEATPIIAKFA